MTTRYLNELIKNEGWKVSETVSVIVPKYKRIRKKINNTQLQSSSDVAKFARKIWDDKIDYCESVYIILVDGSHSVIGHCKISEGGRTSSTVDIAKILSLALITNSTGFFFLHNHPSGLMEFSEADKKISKALYDGGQTVGINLIDSIIISSSSYRSMIHQNIL